jgi:VanZ family protein
MSIKSMAKVCSVAALVLLVYAALGPAKLVPRSGLGWQIDHFLGYFAFTLMVCLAWPRPLVVGGAFMTLAGLLEGLQALTPDRFADFHAAMISAGGSLAAMLPADLFIRSRLNWRTVLVLQRFRLRWSLLTGGRVALSVVTRAVVPQSPALAGLAMILGIGFAAAAPSEQHAEPAPPQIGHCALPSETPATPAN